MNTEVTFIVTMLLLCLALIAYGTRQWLILIKTLQFLYVLRVRRKFDEIVDDLEQYERAALDVAIVAWEEYGRTVEIDRELKPDLHLRDQLTDFFESVFGFTFERPDPVRDVFRAYVVRIALLPLLGEAERFVVKHRKHLPEDEVELFDDAVERCDTMLLEAESEVIDLGFDLAKIQTEYIDKIAA